MNQFHILIRIFYELIMDFLNFFKKLSRKKLIFTAAFFQYSVYCFLMICSRYSRQSKKAGRNFRSLLLYNLQVMRHFLFPGR